MEPRFKEYQEKYNQIEKFVNSLLKDLQMEKIAPAGKWTYAFIISGNHLDFPYRDNVRRSSVSEITRRLIGGNKNVNHYR